MSSDKVIMTHEGYEKIAEELNVLKTKGRREAADQLAVARAHGDLRENAEYDAAKEAKKHLETRIAIMEGKLSSAQIVDVRDLPTDRACFGTTVELKNLDSGDPVVFTLVAEDETDLAQGKISITSPIAKGLLGKMEGEFAEIQIPVGKVRYKVIKISRE